MIVGGRTFSVSQLTPLFKFRSAANTILNAQRLSSENILMMLLFSTCIPVMTYACVAVPYSTTQFRSLNVAVSDCVRHIFGYDRWESVQYLIMSMGYPSLTDIFYRLRENFLKYSAYREPNFLAVVVFSSLF